MSELSRLREALDREDQSITACLARRFHIAARIAFAKLSEGMPIRDFAREAEVLRRVAAVADHENPQFATNILCVYRAILEQSVETQKKIFEEVQHE